MDIGGSSGVLGGVGIVRRGMVSGLRISIGWSRFDSFVGLWDLCNLQGELVN